MARPKQDPQIRINEILAAADSLFHKRGYQKTMVGDIAKKVGVAHGTFYYYFKSKEEIIEALINRRLLKVQTEIETMLSDKQISLPRKMELMGDILLKAIRSKEGLLLEYLYTARSLYLIDRLMRRGKRMLSPYMLSLAKEGKRRGVFATQSPEASVAYILAIIQCHIESIYDKESPRVLTQQLNLGKRLIETALGLREGGLPA